jgi:hypothetical protein
MPHAVNRKLWRTDLETRLISTVFLGLDNDVFETMVFHQDVELYAEHHTQSIDYAKYWFPRRRR